MAALMLGAPGVARDRASLVVPVLMYHHFAEPGPAIRTDTLRWTVSPAQFARQVEYLKAHGFRTIDSRMMADALLRGKPLPEHAVMLTFDDGWQEQYSVVFPLLKQKGMTGVFFVYTGALSQTTPSGGYMSWPEICEMRESGMDIESHTVSHPSLPRLDDKRLAAELRESKAILDLKLDVPVVALAYPYGDFTQREETEAERAGYEIAFSTEVGLGQEKARPYEIHRTIIAFTDTLDDFEIKVSEPGGERAQLDYSPSVTPPPVR
jgi:peptidoglycan/xylan/chitin deacetylase (PgdA/CDA1 family)